MEIEFDPEKSARNARERGLPFELAAEIDWSAAHTIEDRREDYGETRLVAFAPLNGRLHVVCYCLRGRRAGSSVSVTNEREERFYVEAKAAYR